MAEAATGGSVNSGTDKTLLPRFVSNNSLALHEMFGGATPHYGMPANWRFSRRALLRSLFAAHLRPCLAAESRSVPGDPVSQALRGFSRLSTLQRRYRVDAAVLLCGVPLFFRKNVGSGYASVETATGPGGPVALQFAAGSSRSRASVNRFGILREAVIEGPGGALRFAFAGFITQSPEQDLEQARRSFLHGSVGGLNVAIAAGECTSLAWASTGACLVEAATSLAVVTLNTSSTVVTPSRTRRQPSSARVFIPPRWAASRRRSLEAFLRMSCRISLLVSIHSKIACRPKNPVWRQSRQPIER